LIAVTVSLGIWIIRTDFWILIRVSAVLTTVLVIVRQLRERRLYLGNSLGAACLLVVVMIFPQIFHALRSPRGLAVVVRETTSPRELIMNQRRISIVTEQAGATSSVDKNVSLNTTADIVRYLPRAIEIGFFAPFPNAWFQKGPGGGSAKSLLVGLETLAMYLIELGACLTLWRQRRRLPVWLLCLIPAMGMLGLGLVVVNMGTLYRLRYPFLILLVIVASESLMNLTALRTWKRQGVEDAALSTTEATTPASRNVND